MVLSHVHLLVTTSYTPRAKKFLGGTESKTSRKLAMLKNSAVVVAAIALTGCASIMNETTHPIKIETKTAGGTFITGADCKMSNDYGSFNAKSGDNTPARRSNKDLDITCSQSGQPDAKGRAISRANAGLAGNIIFGGGIGAIIDHNKGTAYTYPNWIQLIFGETLVFDRRDEKEGVPVVGKKPEELAAK